MNAAPSTIGPYVVLARLGRGAAGAAYLARPYGENSGVPTPFVLKVLHATKIDESDFVERFLHEAKVAVRIDSAHVASVFDVGRFEENHYLAMEYVPGWTYGKVVHAVCSGEGEVSLPIVHRLIADVAKGLRALHDATDEDGKRIDVIHRDVSPKNLMVSDAGRGYVIDLGLAKSRVQEWKTEAGRIMGSPGYMAPEQIQAQPLDGRADIYPLGAIGWELLTQRRWIPKSEPLNMLRQALQQNFIPPSTHRAGLSSEIDELIQKTVERNPAKRFKTCTELLEAMESVFPAAADGYEVQEFLRELIPSAYSSRGKEVARLLELPLPGPPREESTVVYVRRPGVRPELDPSHVTEARVLGSPLGPPPKAAMVDGNLGESVKSLGSAAQRAREPGADLDGDRSGRTQDRLSWSLSFAGGAPKLSVGLILVGVALGLAAIVGGRFWSTPETLLSESEAPRVDPPVVRERPGVVVQPRRPLPGVRATPSSSPVQTPSRAAPVAVERGANSVAPKARSSPRRGPRKGASPFSAEEGGSMAAKPSKPDARTRASNLQSAAIRFKSTLSEGDPRRTSVDLLLARLAMLKAAGLGVDEDVQLERLEVELQGLRKVP